MNKKLLIFTLTLGLWIIFTGSFNIQALLLGIIVCITISLVLSNTLFRPVQVSSTNKLFLKICYIFLVLCAYIYHSFLSALKISINAFKLKPSFSPRIVKIETSIQNLNSILVLSNFLTLTQESLVIGLDVLDRNYFIKCVYINNDGELEEKKAFINKHENLIAKIFD